MRDLRSNLPSISEAYAFFDQLTTFSRRILTAQQLGGRGSCWGAPSWPEGQSINHVAGVVLHYTADPDMRRVLRWFCNPALRARVSSHLVVGEFSYPWANAFDFDLPLVSQLPVTVIQCRTLDQGAWHATWCNPTHYSIENVNAGELRLNGDEWAWAGPRDADKKHFKEPIHPHCNGSGTPSYRRDGRSWQPYTRQQVHANVTILRYLVALSEGIEPCSIVTHEMVQGIETAGAHGHDKRDCGPLFPLREIREAVFTGKMPIVQPEEWIDRAALNFWEVEDAGPSPKDPSEALRRLMQLGGTKSPQFSKRASMVLRLLGYSLSPRQPESWADVDINSLVRSTKYFQRMMNLDADGLIGEKTAAALSWRMADRLALSL